MLCYCEGQKETVKKNKLIIFTTENLTSLAFGQPASRGFSLAYAVVGGMWIDRQVTRTTL